MRAEVPGQVGIRTGARIWEIPYSPGFVCCPGSSSVSRVIQVAREGVFSSGHPLSAGLSTDGYGCYPVRGSWLTALALVSHFPP